MNHGRAAPDSGCWSRPRGAPPGPRPARASSRRSRRAPCSSPRPAPPPRPRPPAAGSSSSPRISGRRAPRSTCTVGPFTRSTTIDFFSDVTDHLNLGFAGHFEANWREWTVLAGSPVRQAREGRDDGRRHSDGSGLRAAVLRVRRDLSARHPAGRPYGPDHARGAGRRPADAHRRRAHRWRPVALARRDADRPDVRRPHRIPHHRHRRDSGSGGTWPASGSPISQSELTYNLIAGLNWRFTQVASVVCRMALHARRHREEQRSTWTCRSTGRSSASTSISKGLGPPWESARGATAGAGEGAGKQALPAQISRRAGACRCARVTPSCVRPSYGASTMRRHNPVRRMPRGCTCDALHPLRQADHHCCDRQVGIQRGADAARIGSSVWHSPCSWRAGQERDELGPRDLDERERP